MAISPIPGRTTAPLPTRYTYDAVSLNGVAGTYVSTPNASANQIIGDIDIRVKAALTDWTPAAQMALLAKSDTGANRAYEFSVISTGKLRFYSGGMAANSDSSVATGFTDGTTNWCRVTRSSATGKVNFYTSADGVSWTALGAEQTDNAGSLATYSGVVTAGTTASGAWYLAGKIYRAQIYNGINGTLAVDFDASRYAGGTTLTGSTGETWTLQGNAVIHPTNNPMLGYLAEGARTNLVVRSNELDDASWGKNNATVSANSAVASDGTTSLDKIVEAATTSTHSVYQTFAGTSGSYTVSVEMKQAERTWGFITEGNSVTATAYFDLANGVVGTVAGTGSPSATITALANGAYRCTMTFTAGANANCQFGPAAGDGAASYAGDITKGIYAGMVGFENASFASSYIPTTTAAVTRNADVLTYPSAGNILDTAGWAYAEYSSSVIDGNYGVAISGTASRVLDHFSATNASTNDGTTEITKTGLVNISTAMRKRAVTWGAGRSVTGDGAIPATGAYDGTLAGTIGIGHRQSTGTEHIFGTIRNLRIGQRQLSASEMQAITS